MANDDGAALRIYLDEDAAPETIANSLRQFEFWEARRAIAEVGGVSQALGSARKVFVAVPRSPTPKSSSNPEPRVDTDFALAKLQDSIRLTWLLATSMVAMGFAAMVAAVLIVVMSAFGHWASVFAVVPVLGFATYMVARLFRVVENELVDRTCRSDRLDRQAFAIQLETVSPGAIAKAGPCAVMNATSGTLRKGETTEWAQMRTQSWLAARVDGTYAKSFVDSLTSMVSSTASYFGPRGRVPNARQTDSNAED